ncbi:MAG: hypothetical protein LPJ89_06240, partial [Hymenobacteraceae bacterium]|nr:hypothetical protein [Hymenobacteraceae bacterium]MDX5397052.1 hypothetical protein [Hymenobacteraceae bacterium]MDX5443370.1 hypothetical protein [Hymenobacteraceae bacterium]MDX5513123.1 hypothetical protein [Hymenobacteraceae bacterium]
KEASIGNWRLINSEQIELNSFYDIHALPINIKEEVQKDTTGTVIIIDIQDQEETLTNDLLKYEILLDGKPVKLSSSKCLKFYSYLSFTTLQIKVHINPAQLPVYKDSVLSTINYTIKDSQANIFYVSFPLHLEMFFYRKIENDTVTIKGEKLYWRSNGEAPFKKIK